MSRLRFVRQWLLLSCFLVIFTAALAQGQSNTGYQPEERQAGKDVIWLPTSQLLVGKMLDMAKVTSQDYLIDLGSGDGRTVITAAKRGAKALGVEYNPDMVDFAKRMAAKEGVSAKAQFIKADLYDTDLSNATVITLFLLPEINMKLRPKIINLKPGVRVVSNSFDMGEWMPDQEASVEEGDKCQTYCKALLWIVPAKVEGVWRLAQGELTLKQSFQMVSGTLKSGSNTSSIIKGRLNGDELSFSAGDDQYTARVAGDTMQGTLKSAGNSTDWSATRVGVSAQARRMGE